jgi:hypothetical protein
MSQSPFGLPDICDGDVHDVLNLLTLVTSMQSASKNQVFMWGHSEGACITELTIEKGAKVQIAVSIDGPTDFTTWSRAPNPLIPPNPRARSSAWSGNNPAALSQVNFLRVQARGDTVVTPDQACEIASYLPGSVNYYLNWNVTPPGVYYGGGPPNCSAFSIPWVNQEFKHPPYPKGTSARLLPDDQPGKPYPSPAPWQKTVLLVYGLRNDLTGNPIQPKDDYHGWIVSRAWPEIVSFVNTFAKSGGWPASLPSAFVQFE